MFRSAASAFLLAPPFVLEFAPAFSVVFGFACSFGLAFGFAFAFTLVVLASSADEAPDAGEGDPRARARSRVCSLRHQAARAAIRPRLQTRVRQDGRCAQTKFTAPVVVKTIRVLLRIYLLECKQSICRKAST